MVPDREAAARAAKILAEAVNAAETERCDDGPGSSPAEVDASIFYDAAAALSERLVVLERERDEAQARWQEMEHPFDATEMRAAVGRADKLEKALRFYADEKRYDEEGRMWTPPVLGGDEGLDRGGLARLVLSGVSVEPQK